MIGAAWLDTVWNEELRQRTDVLIRSPTWKRDNSITDYVMQWNLQSVGRPRNTAHRTASQKDLGKAKANSKNQLQRKKKFEYSLK